MQSGDGFARIAVAPHADFVQSVTFCVIADGEGEWQSIFDDYGIAADVSLAADAAELVDAGISADVGAVFDDDMTGKRGRVRHDYVIADETIMRHVCLGHEEAVIADLRYIPATRSAAMNRDEFANPRATADLSFGFLAGKLQILWRQPDRHKRVNMAFVADTRAAIDHAMRVDDHAVAEHHFVANDCVRTDATLVAELCARADYGRWMDVSETIFD